MANRSVTPANLSEHAARMASQQLPLEKGNTNSLFMVFCPELGVLSEHTTITDAVRAMVRHLQSHPDSSVALYRRGDQSWQLH